MRNAPALFPNMISFRPPCSLLLLCLVLLVSGFGTPVGAQPTPAIEEFDLVLVGNHLNTDDHQISLKTNPSRGGEWTAVDRPDQSIHCSTTDDVLVVSALSAQQYVGQDIRENHLSLKITTLNANSEGTLRAIYALPSINSLNENGCTRLARLIRATPATVRRHSLASYARPRPASLQADAPFIDHVEVPVRHHKPGVMEVEWLEILFSDGNS